MSKSSWRGLNKSAMLRRYQQTNEPEPADLPGPGRAAALTITAAQERETLPEPLTIVSFLPKTPAKPEFIIPPDGKLATLHDADLRLHIAQIGRSFIISDRPGRTEIITLPS